MITYPTDLASVEAIALRAAADAALAIELVGQFFGNQIDAGAVLREEIAAHIQVCAERVGARQPAFADRAALEAAEMIARLPSGWHDGEIAD